MKKHLWLAPLALAAASCNSTAQNAAPKAPLQAAPVRLAQNTETNKPVDPNKIYKIGEGALTTPVWLRVSPTGTLIVLDRRGDAPVIVTYSADGQKLSELPVPAELKTANGVWGDSKGNFYLTAPDGRSVVQLTPDGKASTVQLAVTARGAALTHEGDDDYLYVLGASAKEGVTKMHLPDTKATTVELSVYPAAGQLTDLRVRANGDLYAFSSNEYLVYHFDSKGKFIEKLGGGGPRPPRVGVPADALSQFYDIAANGDLIWSMANYGALLRISADGKSAVSFNANEQGLTAWTGPIHTLTGLVVYGQRAYEMDLGIKRINSFPLSVVADGAIRTNSVDARIFGFSYAVASDAPYKVFTGDSGALHLDFAEGNRSVHKIAMDYRLRDFDDKTVKEGTVDLDVAGNAAQTLPLPAMPLPKLGWYQLDTTLRIGKDVLQQQVHFLSRVTADPRMPIPAKEVSGWNDTDTHRMIGMRLHRFGGSIQALLDLKPDVQHAKEIGIPYFLALTDEKDCTPENVTKLLNAYPDLPILEIVNEPNLRMSVEKYVALLKPCYDAAKRANPKVKIMGPTQCGTELNWFESFFKNGGGSSVDIVSVHTYERHNSMDFAHWEWKFDQLRAIMAKYGAGNKPLYQTEHGALGEYHGPYLRHRWQARQVLLETMTLARHGIGMDQYYYYYVNAGGFADFSAYLVNGDRELFPAATMTRVRTGMIGDRKFGSVLDFGTTGNRILMGNRWSGADGDLVELANTGTLRPVELEGALPGGARLRDSFGNTLPATNKISVGQYPLYVQLPRGAEFNLKVPSFGRDITKEAKLAALGADGKPDTGVPDAGKPDTPEGAAERLARLTNGVMEFDFESEPLRVGFRAKDDDLPLDVTATFAAPRRISGAILYATYADNDKASPVEYEVQVHTGGDWKTVETVNVPRDEQILKIGSTTKNVTWYDSPWIFAHRFTPVTADALRFHIIHTTHGQYPTAEMNKAVSIAFGGDGKPMPEHAELRELQVFE